MRTIGMVNNRRVIKNFRNEVDIVKLQGVVFEKLEARFPSPPVIMVDFWVQISV
jgi:hypothetical protein